MDKDRAQILLPDYLQVEQSTDEGDGPTEIYLSARGNLLQSAVCKFLLEVLSLVASNSCIAAKPGVHAQCTIR